MCCLGEGNARARTHVCACVRVCVHVCVHACVRVCVGQYLNHAHRPIYVFVIVVSTKHSRLLCHETTFLVNGYKVDCRILTD